jgi:hypothetical protein
MFHHRSACYIILTARKRQALSGIRRADAGGYRLAIGASSSHSLWFWRVASGQIDRQALDGRCKIVNVSFGVYGESPARILVPRKGLGDFRIGTIANDETDITSADRMKVRDISIGITVGDSSAGKITTQHFGRTLFPLPRPKSGKGRPIAQIIAKRRSHGTWECARQVASCVPTGAGLECGRCGAPNQKNRSSTRKHMKLIRGILELAFGVFCLLAVVLFATGTLNPPPGRTIGPINYIFGAALAAGAFFIGVVDIRAATSKAKDEKQDDKDQ